MIDDVVYRTMKHISIQAASIARQVHDYIDEGRGPPGVKEMQRFIDDATAIADLYVEANHSVIKKAGSKRRTR